MELFMFFRGWGFLIRTLKKRKKRRSALEMNTQAKPIRLYGLAEIISLGLTETDIRPKAFRLATAVCNGLAVPPARVIRGEEIHQFWDGDTPNVPIEVAQNIWQRCQEAFGIGKLIARSAGQEDGEEFSFAGQQKSVPDIESAESLKEAMEVIMAASRSEEIRRYLEAAGGSLDEEGLIDILIMLQRDNMAGILFSGVSLNGDSGDDDRYVVVQVSAGTNFGLTAGTETGDILFLNPDDGKCIHSIPDEPIVFECTGEVHAALCEHARVLKALYGFEVDLEWGRLPDGTIETYQVRPITGTGVYSAANLRLKVILATTSKMRHAMNNLVSRGAQVTGENVWSDQNIAELITDHPSRMAFGIFTYIFAHGEGAIRVGRNLMGYDVGVELTDGFFELIGGRPRCSISHDALTYRIAGIPLIDYITGFVDRYLTMIADDPQLANYPEIVLYDQNPSEDQLVQLFGPIKGARYVECYRRFFIGIRQLEDTVTAEFDSFVGIFQQYIGRRRAELAHPDSLSMEDLVRECQSLLDHLRTVSCVMYVKIARLGFFAYARLRRQLEKMYGAKKGVHLLDQITAGLEGDSSMLFNVRLAEFRDGAIEIDDFMREFGHLGPNELEIANPRYRDQVELIRQLAKSIKGNPAKALKERATAARDLSGQILLQCDSEFVDELRRDIKIARKYLAMREMEKLHYLMEYDLLRTLLVAIARKLEIREELIFELDPRELLMAVGEPEIVRELVAKRDRERLALNYLPVPQVVSRSILSDIGRDTFDPDAKVLMGIGVVPVVTTGKAVIVRSPNDMDAISLLTEGSVLVTVTTDPTWAAIIASTGENGALVTEIGGPLAHGAVVSRDLNIACVQNVQGATRRFVTGDTIQVDGINGTVTIIEE